jgi:multicomponent K+:H+ antiporter subunit E
MSRVIPYPLISFLLLMMWLLLTRFSLGYLVLGSLIAIGAGKAVESLHPETPILRGWRSLPRLIWVLFKDIIRSNIAVTRLILSEGWSGRRSGIIDVPLSLHSETALAVLAVILTATPGTAWLEYTSDSGTLTLHIFDAAEAESYLDMILKTYEPLLKEIFE